MTEKESRHLPNINKITKTAIKNIAPVIITPAIVIGIHGAIPNIDNDGTIFQPQSHHQVYDDKTLEQNYSQIIWDPKYTINKQALNNSVESKLSPDQLSLGTKIAVTLSLLSLLSYSLAKASEFSKYSDTHQKYAMWAGVGLQAAASLAIIVEAFK